MLGNFIYMKQRVVFRNSFNKPKEEIASIDHLRREEIGTLLDQQRGRERERVLILCIIVVAVFFFFFFFFLPG